MTDVEKLRKQLRDQQLGFYVGVPHEFIKPINYVGTVNGIFEVRNTPVGRFIAPVTTINHCNIEEKMVPGVKFTHGKIPFRMVRQFLAFARKVLEVHKSEAYAEIRWDEANEEYVMLVPHQDASGGAAEPWKIEKRQANGIEETPHLQVMQIHSHPTFSGNFSGKDNHDDRTCWDALAFGVFGDIMSDQLTMEFRINVGGTYVPMTIYDLFANPMVDNQNSGELIFPEEWLERIHTQSYGCNFYNDNVSQFRGIRHHTPSLFKDPELEGEWDFTGPAANLPLVERIMLVVEQTSSLDMARAMVHHITLDLREPEIDSLIKNLGQSGMDLNTITLLGLIDDRDELLAF